MVQAPTLITPSRRFPAIPITKSTNDVGATWKCDTSSKQYLSYTWLGKPFVHFAGEQTNTSQDDDLIVTKTAIMYSPRGNRTRAGRFLPKPNVPLKKGLFVDGSWYCNCDPRQSAVHLQTKNGGKNHGRWFYTCQKGQTKRCNFFLWDDDAKLREKTAVLSNSRTEPAAAQAGETVEVEPRTPQKSRDATKTNSVPTPPSSIAQSASPASQIQYTPSRSSKSSKPHQQDFLTTAVADEDNSFSISLSNEADLIAAADAVEQASFMPPPETPRKAQKTDIFSTPGRKRLFSEMESDPRGKSREWQTPALEDDVFSTAPTSSPQPLLYPRLQLPSPKKTPSPRRFKDVLLSHDDDANKSGTDLDTLTSQVLTLLTHHHISLPPAADEDLRNLLSRQELRTQGIIKGRDISRIALKEKESKIAELQARIGNLEAEKEMNRNVIAHLKSDILTSSAKRKGGRKT